MFPLAMTFRSVTDAGYGVVDCTRKVENCKRDHSSEAGYGQVVLYSMRRSCPLTVARGMEMSKTISPGMLKVSVDMRGR